jgi:hypothetical protein
MSSQVNPNSIDAQFPVPGVNQPSQGFRSNFLAIQNSFAQYVLEANDLINKVIVSAPLTYVANVSINNFGGMQNSNLSLFDFALVTGNISAATANSVPSLNFSNSSVANISITATTPVTQTINVANFPGLGYSEIKLIVSATNPPQFLDFTHLAIGATIYGGSKIANYNSGNLVIVDTALHELTLGSADGFNWFIDSPSTAVARTSVPTTSVGSAGDTSGMIAVGNGNIYVCTNNYDGITHIWQFANLSSF